MESYLRNYFKRHITSIHLMAIIAWQMMYFRRPARCFHTIWLISAVKLQGYVLKPENTDTTLQEKKESGFPTKYMAVGMQLHHYRSLFRTRLLSAQAASNGNGPFCWIHSITRSLPTAQPLPKAAITPTITVSMYSSNLWIKEKRRHPR